MYTAHLRDHFFLNGAVTGGLLLLQSFGPGMFTVQHVLLGKQE